MTRIDSGSTHAPPRPPARNQERNEREFATHLGNPPERSARHIGRGAEGTVTNGVEEGGPVPANMRMPREQPAERAFDAAGGYAFFQAAAAPAADVLRAQGEGRTVASLAGGAFVQLFEQHWFANGYLSFIANASVEAEGGRPPGQAATQRLPEGSAHANSEGVPAVDTTAHRDDAPLPQALSWPVVLDGLASTASGTARSIDRLAGSLGPVLLSDQPWPERLIRLTTSGRGKATLWVRDYALPSSAIPALVSRLRQQAATAGVALERIVLNGATVWQPDTTKGELDHGR